MTTPDVFIDSFGARWQDAPPPRYRAAVLGINLTDQLLNPPDDPALNVSVPAVPAVHRDPQGFEVASYLPVAIAQAPNPAAAVV